MKLPEPLQNRLINLCSLSRITDEYHIGEVYMLKLEAKSICHEIERMLTYQKFLPNPVDFWTNQYQAVVDPAACKYCGRCVTRCQVNAVTLSGPNSKATVNLSRCIRLRSLCSDLSGKGCQSER